METGIMIGQVFKSLWEAINELEPIEQAEIYNAIFEYQFTGEIPKFENKYLKTLFISHKPTLDKMIHNQKTKMENGKKGGAPKGNNNAKKETTENKQEQPKTTENNQKQAEITINKKQEIINKKQEIEKEIKKEKENQAETAPLVLPQAKQILNSPKKPVNAILKPKTLNRQQLLYEYFSGKYKANTGFEYLSGKKDFVLLANLAKKFDSETVKQKIDWLETGCLHSGVFWFAKDKKDFTIGNLHSHWNEIIPTLTEEQKKQQAEAAEREKHKADLRRRGIQC